MEEKSIKTYDKFDLTDKNKKNQNSEIFSNKYLVMDYKDKD